jgi:hypothetical protein
MKAAMWVSGILLATLAISIAPARQLQAEADRVITAEEIDLSGLTRLSDILSLVLELDALTVDGFNWQFEPAGHYPDYRSDWILLLDGQRLEPGRFGYPALNSLPVNSDQIERIELFTTPVILQTGVATQGVIHIHTTGKLDKQGACGHLQYSAGNETGDPGPHRYTEHNSRNVDRSGVDMVARLDYQHADSYTRLSLFAADHYPTDATAYWRNQDIFRENFPMQLVAGGLLKSSLTRGDNQFTSLIGHFQSQDLLYFAPAAGEVPLREDWRYGGLSGHRSLNSRTDLHFATTYIRHKLDRWYSAALPHFDWQSGYLRSNATWICQRDNSAQQITAELSHQHTSSLDNDNHGLTRLTMSGSTRRQTGDELASEMALQLQAGDGGVGGTVLLGGYWQPHSFQKLNLVLSATIQPPAATADFSFWTEQGYDFLDLNNVQHNDVEAPAAVRTASLDGKWRIEGRGCHLRINGRWQLIDELQLYRQDYQYDVGEGTFSSPLDSCPGQQGQLLSGGLRFSWQPAIIPEQPGTKQPRLSQILEWRCQHLLSGSVLFGDHFRHHPAHKIGMTVLYRHSERITMTLRINYRSRTLWQEYQRAVIAAGDLYSSPVPGVTTCDIALHKRLWGPRLNGSLLVRNIFNATDLYHPLGAHFDLSFFLRLELILGD